MIVYEDPNLDPLISWTRGYTELEGNGEQAPRLLKKHWKETNLAWNSQHSGLSAVE